MAVNKSVCVFSYSKTTYQLQFSLDVCATHERMRNNVDLVEG